MLHQLIHVNYTTMLLIIFMTTFLLSNVVFNKRITRLFFVSILSVLILLIADSIESWTATFSEPTLLRILMSSIGYTVRPFAILYIILIVIRDIETNKRLLLIPAILNTIISFSAIFTNIAFSYAPDNEFVRGPLGLSAYIVSIFYLFTLLIVTIRYLKERHYYESLVVFCIIIVAVLSLYLEVAYAFDGFINAAFAVSITFYYLFFHAQTFKRDSLTQAFNRRCFYTDAERDFARLKAVISIDLNDLKRLNDEQGHSCGDMALCTLVKKAEPLLPSGCNLYRTGGDEFMILCFKHSQSTFEKMIDNFRAEMAKTPYTCAIGLAMVESDETFHQVCARADAYMYENKAIIKGKSPR